MASNDGPPRLYVSLALLPALVVAFAAYWYCCWLVVQGYPPLRIASLELAAVAVVALPAGVAVRRWTRQQHELHNDGLRKLPEPLDPRARDWIASALYGALVIPLSIGTLGVALTRVPIAVVAIAAFGGRAWRLVLVRRLPGLRSLTTIALSAAGLVVLATGPDATDTTVIALLLLAPMVRAAGGRAWDAISPPGRHKVAAIGWLTAAIVLQIAGLVRGEIFGDAPLRSTLAIAAPLCVLAGLALAAIARPAHRGVIGLSSAGTLLAVVLIGETWCGQTGATSTWIAAALVGIAILVEPPDLGDLKRL